MKITKDKLVEITVKLIEENGGAQGVNMRSVAKSAECAHTNVYNYFESYESLLWAAMYKSLQIFTNYVDKRIETMKQQGTDMYMAILIRQIDFAEDYPGLYRFIFFDTRFYSEMPDEIREYLGEMNKKISLLIKPISKRIKKENANDIIQGYLQGEICRVLQNRFPETSPDHAKKVIENNLKLLCELLLS